MLVNYDSLQVMLFVFTYLVIYNLTSFIFFTTFLQFLNVQILTLFSLTSLNQVNFFTKVLSITLLSLAGVPPFIGFFSKIFTVILVANSQLFILFVPFFTLLFTGLYFYIQNIRFLHSTALNNLPHIIEVSLRFSLLYIYLVLPSLFVLIFGFCFMDDLFLIISWLLI